VVEFVRWVVVEFVVVVVRRIVEIRQSISRAMLADEAEWK
jgi:hypothetical protein